MYTHVSRSRYVIQCRLKNVTKIKSCGALDVEIWEICVNKLHPLAFAIDSDQVLRVVNICGLVGVTISRVGKYH